MIPVPELRQRDCFPSILKYRAHVLNERLLNSSAGIAQRVQVHLAKSIGARPNIDLLGGIDSVRTK